MTKFFEIAQGDFINMENVTRILFEKDEVTLIFTNDRNSSWRLNEADYLDLANYLMENSELDRRALTPLSPGVKPSQQSEE